MDANDRGGVTRRQTLRWLGLGVAAAVTGGELAAAAAPAVAKAGPYVLPPLPYAVDALEPHVDALTMEIHHDRHHAAYVASANKALEALPALAALPVEDLLRKLSEVPEPARTALRNHAGGHHNHSLFWRSMRRGGGGEPRGPLAVAIRTAFGSFDGFREKFTAAALGQFGSGWAWLSRDSRGALVVHATANQDSPLMADLTPLLGLDVWEHAYYLKHQNRRADHVAAFWKVVDWDEVAAR